METGLGRAAEIWRKWSFYCSSFESIACLLRQIGELDSCTNLAKLLFLSSVTEPFTKSGKPYSCRDQLSHDWPLCSQSRLNCVGHTYSIIFNCDLPKMAMYGRIKATQGRCDKASDKRTFALLW